MMPLGFSFRPRRDDLGSVRSPHNGSGWYLSGMSRDSLFKWSLIALTVASAAGLIAMQGLSFPKEDLVYPLKFALFLGAAAWYFRRRGIENFDTVLTALQHVCLFTFCYSPMMYALATLDRPLIDDLLVRFDASVGIHLPSLVAWSHAHPELESHLQWIYDSMLLQTPLVFIVLGFSGQQRAIRQFVLHFMLGTWVCAIMFALFPAAGPFVAYGYDMDPTQTRYLQHLNELREGVRTIVTWKKAEGLITFPSFHTIWAIILFWAVRRQKWLLGISLIFNAIVIASTLTTGWHYGADVLSGIFVSIGLIWVVEKLTCWLEQADRTAKVADTEEYQIPTELTDELADRLLPVPEPQPSELVMSPH